MTPESSMRITADDASWIASIVAISTTIGSVLSGPLMDRFGRKTTSLASCFPLVISWLIIAYVKNVYGIYCGRLLSGLAAGISTSSLVYISEVSHPRWRPTCMCFISISASLGILLVCILGQWFNYEQMAICFAAISMATLLGMLPLPESPQWLLRFRNQHQASLALMWFYRREECFQYQLRSLIDSYTPPSTSTNENNFLLSEYTKKSTLKPVVILMFIILLQQISGAYVVIFYAVNVLQVAGGRLGPGMNEYGALALLGVVRFGMSVFTAIASRRIGRRPLCIISGLGMAACTLVAAISIHKNENFGNLFFKVMNKTDIPYQIGISTTHYNSSSVWNSYAGLVSLAPVNNFSKSLNDQFTTTVESTITMSSIVDSSGIPSWVPVACILAYIFFCSLGVMIIPWNLIGELLPQSVKGSCGGIMNGFANVAMFAVVKSFPYLLEIFKTQGMFYLFTVTSLSWVVFIHAFLPETRGKSSAEIDAYFK